jgi:HTH-type transcriptional regulator / antitoxin HigA
MIEIFPIKSKEDYQKALYLLEHTPVEGKVNEERIEILAQLVELWEKKTFALVKKNAPGEVLRELMLAKRVNQGEIAQVIGTSQTNVSALMSGKRKLNSDQVAILCEFFNVLPEVFGEVKKARFRVLKLKPKKTSGVSSINELFHQKR